MTFEELYKHELDQISALGTQVLALSCPGHGVASSTASGTAATAPAAARARLE